MKRTDIKNDAIYEFKQKVHNTNLVHVTEISKQIVTFRYIISLDPFEYDYGDKSIAIRYFSEQCLRELDINNLPEDFVLNVPTNKKNKHNLVSVLNKEKIEKAIMRFKTFEPEEGYYIAFSGGKDSIVIKQLAIEAGVKFDAHYNNTTVDPPELIYYMREHHKDLIWEKPEKTMWELIVDKGTPPTRIMRYCCDVLKEGGGLGRFVVTGVRWAESTRRARTRNLVETNFGSTQKGIVLKLNNDNEEARRMVEHCPIKSRHILNPIIDWTDEEVWGFIEDRKLPYCELYDKGRHRIGCIGCPMAGWKNAEKDFENYPKYKQTYIRTFDRMIAKRLEDGKPCNWDNGEDVLNWYLEKPVDKVNIKQKIQIYCANEECLYNKGLGGCSSSTLVLDDTGKCIPQNTL